MRMRYHHRYSTPSAGHSAVFICMNSDLKKIKNCACVAQTVQFALLRRWAIYRSSANWTVCATQAAVSYFIQSTHSSENCSSLFMIITPPIILYTSSAERPCSSGARRRLTFTNKLDSRAPAQRRHSLPMPYSPEKSLFERTWLDL